MKYFQWVAVSILWANALPAMAHDPILALYELGSAHLQAGQAESNGYGDLVEIPSELVKECVEVEEVWVKWPCHYSKARAYFSQALAMDEEIPSDTRTSALNYLGDIYRDGLGVSTRFGCGEKPGFSKKIPIAA